MEVLTLLQSQIDSILCLMGVVLFLVFMTSSRLYVLAICAGLLLASHQPASAFNLKIDSIAGSNVYISGFSTGRIYQVLAAVDLGRPSTYQYSFFVPETNSVLTVSGFQITNIVRISAGWYEDPMVPGGTNLVWYDAYYSTNFLYCGVYGADDITIDFRDLSDKKQFCVSAVCGVCLFFCFSRAFL